MMQNCKNNNAEVAAKSFPDKNDAFFCYAVAAAIYLIASLLLGAVQGVVTYGGVVWWVCLAVSNLAIGLSAVVYCKVRGKKVIGFVAADVAPDPVHTAVGCVFIVGLVCFMSPVTNWIYDLMQRLGLERPSVALPEQLVPLLLTATLLPALNEEIVFRGIVGNGLVRGCKSKVNAVLLSGALFSLFHANPAQTMHQFFVGCFLTLLLLRGGSLWSCVIVHFVNNLVVVVADFTLPDAFFTSWITCLVGGIVAVVAFVVYLFATKPSKKSAMFVNEKEETVTSTSAVVACIVTVVVFAALWVMNL